MSDEAFINRWRWSLIAILPLIAFLALYLATLMTQVKRDIQVCNAIPGISEYFVYADTRPNSGFLLNSILRDKNSYTTTVKRVSSGTLEAGECNEITVRNAGFFHNKSVFGYARSSDQTYLKNVYNISSGTIDFGGDYAPTNNNSSLSRRIKIRKKSSKSYLSFHKYDFRKKKPIFLLSDENTSILRGYTTKTDIQGELKNAAALKRSFQILRNNPAYLRSNYTPPYFLGFTSRNVSTFLRVGIRVDSVYKNTPASHIGLKRGDDIVKLGLYEIFSLADARYALVWHANKYGVEVGIPIVVRRGNDTFTATVMYLFNPNYFGYSKKDRDAAAMWGAGDAIALGASVTTYCGGLKVKEAACKSACAVRSWLKETSGCGVQCPSYNAKRCYFNNVQRVARLQQMYPKEFKNGGFVGMFAPTSRLLALGKLSGGNKILKLGRLPQFKGLPKSVMTEVLDTAIWETLRAPAGTSAATILNNIKSEVPYAVGIGIVFGKLTQRRSR